MDVGVMMFPTDRAIRPDELARAAEERGIESLFVPEHTHIPASRATPFPGGGDLPDHYRRTYDPFVALAVAAAVTERLRVATGICLVAQRDPLVLAKEVASHDLLSGGRFVFGIGFGWNIEEMVHHGVDPARRWAVVREKVLAMRALWTEDDASFDGDHVRFSATWSWPKPAQRPHPPILIGGRGTPTTFRAVIDDADGWMPSEGRGDLVGPLEDLRRRAEEAGRDPATLEISVFGSRGRPEDVERYAAAGVRRVIVGLPSAPADEVLPRLDRVARLVAEVAA